MTQILLRSSLTVKTEHPHDDAGERSEEHMYMRRIYPPRVCI